MCYDLLKAFLCTESYRVDIDLSPKKITCCLSRRDFKMMLLIIYDEKRKFKKYDGYKLTYRLLLHATLPNIVNHCLRENYEELEG